MRDDTKINNKGKILAVVILLFIVLITLFSNSEFIDKLKAVFNNKNMILTKEENVDIILQDENLYKVYDSYIVVQQEKNLNCYDLKGNIVWSHNILIENPLIYLGDDNIVIGNKEKGLIYAIGLNNEELWKFDCKQPIEYIYGQSDRVVIFTVFSEKLNQAMILDNNGQLLVNITIENEAILLYNISNNKDYFAITTMDLGNMSNKMKLYSSDGYLIWDRLFENQFINSIDFIKKDGLLVTTDQKVLFFDYKNQLIWKRDIGGLLKYILIDSHMNNIYVLYHDKGNYLEVIDFHGRTKEKISLDGDYDKICVNNTSNVFLGGEKDILGLHNNIVFLKYHSDIEINDFALSNKKLIIVTPKGIDIMEMQDSQ